MDGLDGSMFLHSDNDTYKAWEQDQLGILTLLYRSLFFISVDDRPVVDVAWLDLLFNPRAVAQGGQPSAAAEEKVGGEEKAARGEPSAPPAVQGGEPSAAAAVQGGEPSGVPRRRSSRLADPQSGEQGGEEDEPAPAAVQGGEPSGGPRKRRSRLADPQTGEQGEEESEFDDTGSVASSLDEMAKAGMKSSWMAHMTHMNKAYKKEIAKLEEVIKECDEGA